jgi:hypothetical protein
MNAFAYAAASPMTRLDPSGLTDISNDLTEGGRCRRAAGCGEWYTGLLDEADNAKDAAARRTRGSPRLERLRLAPS